MRKRKRKVKVRAVCTATATVGFATIVDLTSLENLAVVSLQVEEAEDFLSEHSRHYTTPATPICAIGVGNKSGLHGAAILGRNKTGDGELAHIYVDGTSQGYSLLYGACWRALKALGYEKAVL